MVALAYEHVLSFIPAAGLPAPNRSHFDAQYQMEMAQSGKAQCPTYSTLQNDVTGICLFFTSFHIDILEVWLPEVFFFDFFCRDIVFIVLELTIFIFIFLIYLISFDFHEFYHDTDTGLICLSLQSDEDFYASPSEIFII